MPRFREGWDPIEDPAMSDLKKGEDPSQKAEELLRELEELLSPFLQAEDETFPLHPDDCNRIVCEIEKLISRLPRLERDQLRRKLSYYKSRIDLQYVPFFEKEVEMVGRALLAGREPLSHPDDVRRDLNYALGILSSRSDEEAVSAVDKLGQSKNLLEIYLKEPLYVFFKRKADELKKILDDRLTWYDDSLDVLAKGLPSPVQISHFDEIASGIPKAKKIFAELVVLERRMKADFVKKMCEDDISYFKERLEIIEFREKAPVLYLQLLAESRELLEKMKNNGGQIEGVGDFIKRVEEFLHRVDSDGYTLHVLQNGTQRLLRVLQAIGADADTSDFFEEIKGRGFSEAKRRAALAILGFTSMPSVEELKRRYRKLVRTYHPDRGGDEKKMKAVVAAFDLLRGHED